MEDSDHNADACAEEEEELHGGDVNSVKVVEDMDADIHREVRLYMSEHAVILLKTFLGLEVALRQQLSYFRRVPSRDAMKDSMAIRDEEESAMTEVDMNERQGAYYL